MQNTGLYMWAQKNKVYYPPNKNYSFNKLNLFTSYIIQISNNIITY